MSVAGTEDQRALEASIEGVLTRHATPEARRAHLGRAGSGELPEAWGALVHQGLLGLHLPPEDGGQGGSLGDLCVLLERSGYALLPGPLLPTVLASALISRHGTNAQRTRWLPVLSGGATAAVAGSSEGVKGAALSGGWLLTGETKAMLASLSSELLILGACCEGEPRWFLVERSTPGLSIFRRDGVDLTRDVADVVVDGLAVDARSALDLDARDLQALKELLFSAEAVGIARWCQETGLAYAKVREQFGRPIGSFQAIKHKCARLFIETELMTASVWDAAIASDDEPEQWRLASAAAAERCLAPTVDLGLATLTLLGGIGYTWDHDLHLYWRRAISIAALLGPGQDRSQRVVDLAISTVRSSPFDLNEESPDFRKRITALLAHAQSLGERERRRYLAEVSLVAPQYPEPYGMGANAREQLVIAEEFARIGLAQPSLSIGDWAVPTVIAHGTDAQRERLVPASLRGELTWCQLFSEPDAGSDLASLRTCAVKVDDGWSLTGSKVWTSSADKADWGICLARTDPEVPKHKGLSFFLVDMTTTGVEVRPLREANGGYLFNEVFLREVFVPDDCLLGEPGRGWQLARTTLGNERLALGVGGGGPAASLTDVLCQLRRFEAKPPPGALMEVAALIARRHALEALGRRVVHAQLRGVEAGPAASLLKVEVASLLADVARAVLDWGGQSTALLGSGADSPAHAYLSTPPHLLGGGTAEIQLNVISEILLGLPRS